MEWPKMRRGNSRWEILRVRNEACSLPVAPGQVLAVWPLLWKMEIGAVEEKRIWTETAMKGG